MYDFIPVSNSTCYGGIARWNVPRSGESNWFVVTAELVDERPSKVCADAVSAATWQAVIM